MSWAVILAFVGVLLLMAALKLGRFVFIVMIVALVLLVLAGFGLLGRKRSGK